MKLWHVSPVERRCYSAAFPEQSIAALGAMGFPAALFKELSLVSELAGIAAGTLDASGSPVSEWTYSRSPVGFTDLCTQCYQPVFASSDPLHAARYRLATRGRRGESLIARVNAEEIGNRAHRASIYDRFNLKEKISISQCIAGGQTLHFTIVRRRDQPPLRAGQVQSLRELAPTLVALLTRHRELQALRPVTVQHNRQRLLTHCPSLTQRELALCLGLLNGRTLSSMADEWNLKASTVSTYRDRAYRRLGIHFRSQLFALMQPGLQAGL
jgi:DNA-binding CsgD family transcriptional regulator